MSANLPLSRQNVCHKCDYLVFCRGGDLGAHVTTQHLFSFQCSAPNCGEITFSKEEIDRHIKKKHRRQKVTFSQIPPPEDMVHSLVLECFGQQLTDRWMQAMVRQAPAASEPQEQNEPVAAVEEEEEAAPVSPEPLEENPPVAAMERMELVEEEELEEEMEEEEEEEAPGPSQQQRDPSRSRQNRQETVDVASKRSPSNSRSSSRSTTRSRELCIVGQWQEGDDSFEDIEDSYDHEDAAPGPSNHMEDIEDLLDTAPGPSNDMEDIEYLLDTAPGPSHRPHQNQSVHQPPVEETAAPPAEPEGEEDPSERIDSAIESVVGDLPEDRSSSEAPKDAELETAKFFREQFEIHAVKFALTHGLQEACKQLCLDGDAIQKWHRKHREVIEKWQDAERSRKTAIVFDGKPPVKQAVAPPADGGYNVDDFYSVKQKLNAIAYSDQYGRSAAAWWYGVQKSDLQRWRHEQPALRAADNSSDDDEAQPAATLPGLKTTKYYTAEFKNEVVRFTRLQGLRKAMLRFPVDPETIQKWVDKADTMMGMTVPSRPTKIEPPAGAKKYDMDKLSYKWQMTVYEPSALGEWRRHLLDTIGQDGILKDFPDARRKRGRPAKEKPRESRYPLRSRTSRQEAVASNSRSSSRSSTRSRELAIVGQSQGGGDSFEDIEDNEDFPDTAPGPSHDLVDIDYLLDTAPGPSHRPHRNTRPPPAAPAASDPQEQNEPVAALEEEEKEAVPVSPKPLEENPPVAAMEEDEELIEEEELEEEMEEEQEEEAPGPSQQHLEDTVGEMEAPNYSTKLKNDAVKFAKHTSLKAAATKFGVDPHLISSWRKNEEIMKQQMEEKWRKNQEIVKRQIYPSTSTTRSRELAIVGQSLGGDESFEDIEYLLDTAPGPSHRPHRNALEEREAIIKYALEHGFSKAAKRFNVSQETIYSWRAALAASDLGWRVWPHYVEKKSSATRNPRSVRFVTNPRPKAAPAFPYGGQDVSSSSVESTASPVRSLSSEDCMQHVISDFTADMSKLLACPGELVVEDETMPEVYHVRGRRIPTLQQWLSSSMPPPPQQPVPQVPAPVLQEAGQEEFDQPTSGQEGFYEPPTGQEEFDEPIHGQEEFDEAPSGQEEFDQPPYGQEEFDEAPTGQEDFDEPIYGQEEFDETPSGQEEFYEPTSGQEEFHESPTGQEEFDQPPTGQEELDQPTSNQEQFDEPIYGQEEIDEAPSGQDEFYEAPSGQDEFDEPPQKKQRSQNQPVAHYSGVTQPYRQITSASVSQAWDVGRGNQQPAATTTARHESHGDEDEDARSQTPRRSQTPVAAPTAPPAPPAQPARPDIPPPTDRPVVYKPLSEWLLGDLTSEELEEMLADEPASVKKAREIRRRQREKVLTHQRLAERYRQLKPTHSEMVEVFRQLRVPPRVENQENQD